MVGTKNTSEPITRVTHQKPSENDLTHTSLGTRGEEAAFHLLIRRVISFLNPLTSFLKADGVTLIFILAQKVFTFRAIVWVSKKAVGHHDTYLIYFVLPYLDPYNFF